MRAGRHRKRVRDGLKERRGVGELGARTKLAVANVEALEQLADVGRLVKFDGAVRQVIDLDAEQVFHRPLVGDVPVGGERVHEDEIFRRAFTFLIFFA